MLSHREQRTIILQLAVSLGLAVFAICLVVVLVTVSASAPSRVAEGIDLEYLLTVNDPSSGQAHVALTVSNLSTDTFEVTDYSWGPEPFLNVVTLSARDMQGVLLPTHHYTYTNWAGNEKDVWKVECTGLTQIVIEYIIEPGWEDAEESGFVTVWGYLGSDFGAMGGSQAFVVPRDATLGRSEVYSVSIAFDLPGDWNAFAPWPRQGNAYNPASPTTYIFENLTFSSFALGNFDLYTKTIGTTEVLVATHHSFPAHLRDAMAQRSWDILAYLTSVFDSSVGGLYLALFFPESPDGYRINTLEWSNSQGYSPEISWAGRLMAPGPIFTHQAFHRWNHFDIGDIGGQPWWADGPAELYSNKAVTKLRLPYYYNMESDLQEHHERYLRDFVATGKDRPVVSVERGDPDSIFFIYRKSEMVVLLLAKEIYLRTDGAFTLDNLMRVLFQKYSYENQRQCDEACIQAELETLTGLDFTEFFDNYVYGTTTLPMDWAFDDDDADGLSNALEIGWDTHPEDEDTDDDSFNDADEIAYGSDPLDPSSFPLYRFAVLQPDAESGIDAQLPEGWIYNYGRWEVLEVGSTQDNPDLHNSLIKFAVNDSLPPSAVVESADLDLYAVFGSAPENIWVHEVLVEWDEGTGQGNEPPTYDGATWAHRSYTVPGDQSSGVPWHGAGCSSSGNDYKAQAEDTASIVDGWHRWHLSAALVQRWMDYPETNYGLVISDHAACAGKVDFASSDYSEPSLRPRLMIQYRLPTSTGRIIKFVTPSEPVRSGDELTYTLVISAVPGTQVGLYDPLTDTTFIRFVGPSKGVTYTTGAITGMLTVTPTNRITLSFVAQVDALSTTDWTDTITNSACVFPLGGTLGECFWSNEVTNSVFPPHSIYLPIVLRNQQNTGLIR